MQVSAVNVASYTPPRPATDSGAPQAPVADLTQLAVVQTNVKMAAAAGAALGQVTAELSGAVVDISA